MEDILVPIGVFGMVVAIVALTVWGAASRRRQVAETLRDAIRAGQTLDPETINALGAEAPKKPAASDLKAGLILIAVSGACVVFGQMIGSEAVSGADEVGPIFLGIAAFPGFIGIVLTLFGLFGLRKPKDADPV